MLQHPAGRKPSLKFTPAFLKAPGHPAFEDFQAVKIGMPRPECCRVSETLSVFLGLDGREIDPD